MENTAIKHLLSQISNIVKKHNELAVATGDNFNIFNILDLSTAEVRLHSKLLAELLNPKGSHNLGDIFLKLFIQRLNNSPLIGELIKISDFENVLIEVERYTGNIDKDKETGGKIDIFIQLPNQCELVIENKIYASDQEGQLRRYHNFNKIKKPLLIYLTLDGKEADEFTTKNENYPQDKIHPILLSYENDIKNWLEECRKEATNLPVVRETITQYINLIKKLTGQTMNNKMRADIVKTLIESGDKVKSAFEIGAALDDVKSALLKKFGEEIMRKVKVAKPEVNVVMWDDFGKKWEGISFNFPTINSISVYFSFLTDYNEAYLEISNENNFWEGKEKKIDIANVNYYKTKLNDVSKNWGKVENTENAWRGDWVCRYNRKMDLWMGDGSFWYEVAENKFNNKAEDVAKDILILLETIKNR